MQDSTVRLKKKKNNGLGGAFDFVLTENSNMVKDTATSDKQTEWTTIVKLKGRL